MGEPTYRPLTGDDLWLPGDALPGLLDGWCGPLETRIGATWRPAVMDPFGTRPVWQPTFDAPVHRLDCRRPEVRDHARRVLLAGERCDTCWDGGPCKRGCRKPADIGPIIEAELRGDITPTEAAGLVWCSLLRVEAGLGVVGLPLTVEPDEGDLSEWLADGWTLWSDGALLMPLPDGVIGRLEVSDG